MDKNIIKASWLHISDLHVFTEADTTMMIYDYAELAKIISPQFLIVTGDFRHKKYNTNFNLALKYLESIISVLRIDKKDVFFVPGNHDVNSYISREQDITDICLNVEKGDYNIYSNYKLHMGFSEYNDFINQFFSGSDVSDIRTTDPSGVNCVVWNNMINILLLNTALISNGKEHNQIVDINALSQCKIDFNRPSILIGHHGIDSLYSCYSERVSGVIDRKKISAYLHGDSHKYANNPISMISSPNCSIPSITCAKSAPQSGDNYSDMGVVYYEWQNDDNTYVQTYSWTQKGFIESTEYYHKVNKRYSFPMIYDKDNKKTQSIFTQTNDQRHSPVGCIVKNDNTLGGQAIMNKLEQSHNKCDTIVSNLHVLNDNNFTLTQSKDNETLEKTITTEDLQAYREKVKLYEELGIINCTNGLKGTDLEPLKCMSNVHNSLFFMGVGGEKWVKDKQLRDSFENMLLRTKSSGTGKVKFLLINPASDDYKNLYLLRGESVPYSSYAYFVEFAKKYSHLEVHLYSNMPSFRMQFVDNTYLAVSRYYFSKSSHEQWGGGWKIPHLIIHNEQKEFGNNEVKYKGSLFESFLLAYNYTWQNGIDIKKWDDEGRNFNK